jgi:MarR family 2-MHQ and catechol resistance regulon transcriptional repressor
MPKRGLKSIRLLAECYQAFEHFSNRHIRSLGLTGAQFDIVATLGNTQGMTFKELGEKTLITKGTLTGVIDRLELRGLVCRCVNNQDGRSTRVQLTAMGEALFAQIFPLHLQYCNRVFELYSDSELQLLEQQLTLFKQRFQLGMQASLSQGESHEQPQ